MRSGHNMKAFAWLQQRHEPFGTIPLRMLSCLHHTIGWVEIKRAEDGLARSGIQPQNGEIYVAVTGY